jgi:3-oxoacyl-[acyl-carrier protein] reductase
VVIASVSGREVDFAVGPYGVFKAALTHYAKGLSFQLAAKNIRVNALSGLN